MMNKALHAYLHAAAQTGEELSAVQAAAEAVAEDPWSVVVLAGRLARAVMVPAPSDIGITARLDWCSVDSKKALTTVPQGAPAPQVRRTTLRKHGAFDTPQDMVRHVVSLAIAATDTNPISGLDPACGPGAFLVAMREFGVREILGTDSDPKCLTVAQIAAPTAQLNLGDGMASGRSVDLAVGNPPFVSPEMQNPALRQQMRKRFPWLRHRFDLCVPFAAATLERVRQGGGLGLVLPASIMVQPYAQALRRNWLENHCIHALEGPLDFPGITSKVTLIALQASTPPQPIPPHNLEPEEILTLSTAPWNPACVPGDIAIAQKIRQQSIILSDVCEVDTGVVSHGPLGGKAKLISKTKPKAASHAVRYVDAKDLGAGRVLWLNYDPPNMHRPKRPELFRGPKILVQRINGRGPTKAWLDTTDMFAGHTLNVVQPGLGPHRVPLTNLHTLLTSSLLAGLRQIETGDRLDLYPRDVANTPVPSAWLNDPSMRLQEAWNLTQKEVSRLQTLTM